MAREHAYEASISWQKGKKSVGAGVLVAAELQSDGMRRARCNYEASYAAGNFNRSNMLLRPLVEIKMLNA